MRTKTALMRLKEYEMGCDIEEFIEAKSRAGKSIPQIAEMLDVSPECLRIWVKELGGEKLIGFPQRETVTA